MSESVRSQFAVRTFVRPVWPTDIRVGLQSYINMKIWHAKYGSSFQDLTIHITVLFVTRSCWVQLKCRGRHGFESSRMLNFSTATSPFCVELSRLKDLYARFCIAMLSIFLSFTRMSGAPVPGPGLRRRRHLMTSMICLLPLYYLRR